MFRITDQQQISKKLAIWTFHAPDIARSAQAGQFVMLRLDETGERLPFTLCEWDTVRGTVTLVIAERGRSTRELRERFSVGDAIRDLSGPLGRPAAVVRYGEVVMVGEGAAAGGALPIARAMRTHGNRIRILIGIDSPEDLFWEDRFRRASDELTICPSASLPDELDVLLTAALADRAVVLGSNRTMRDCAQRTRSRGVSTAVSLKTIMVDGAGQCGSCRVRVGGETRFACLEGPEFDGHLVDFDELESRQGRFGRQEAIAAGELERRCRVRSLLFEEGRHDVHKIRQVAPRAVRPVERPVRRRLTDMAEVEATYRWPDALAEADRCLQCARPACVSGCPAGVDIPGFIRQLLVCNVEGARDTILEAHPFPEICGRVCAQERQCEAQCVVGKMVEPVAIGRLERFIGDVAPVAPTQRSRAAESTGRVAVVGSGPAGLACAEALAARGIPVTVFEALHEAGGLLRTGIPAFVLPREVLERHLERLEAMDVDIQTNFVVGRRRTIDSLMKEKGFAAVFVGAGASLPILSGAPGENARQVYTANELLTRVNLMRSDEFPYRGTPLDLGDRLVILGSGNTAIDCARLARRLGVSDVHCVYRRSRVEAPARARDIRRASEEGVHFHWLESPEEILVSAEGNVEGIRLQPMRLGEPGADGRRCPEPSGEPARTLACTAVVLALGARMNPLWQDGAPELERTPSGLPVVDPKTQATSVAGVFAGGDGVTGPTTVVSALAAGRRAAAGIAAFLASQSWPAPISEEAPARPGRGQRPRACERCGRPRLEDDEAICCAESLLAWRCLGCGKRSEGFAFPYGFCPSCGGELELIEQEPQMPEDLTAIQEALELSLGGVAFFEQAAREARDVSSRVLLERLADRERRHVATIEQRYHVTAGQASPVETERVALYAGVAPPEDDPVALLELALLLEKRSRDHFASRREQHPEGSPSRQLYRELEAEEQDHVLRLETELERLRKGEPGLL